VPGPAIDFLFSSRARRGRPCPICTAAALQASSQRAGLGEPRPLVLDQDRTLAAAVAFVPARLAQLPTRIVDAKLRCRSREAASVVTWFAPASVNAPNALPFKRFAGVTPARRLDRSERTRQRTSPPALTRAAGARARAAAGPVVSPASHCRRRPSTVPVTVQASPLLCDCRPHPPVFANCRLVAALAPVRGRPPRSSRSAPPA